MICKQVDGKNDFDFYFTKKKNGLSFFSKKYNSIVLGDQISDGNESIEALPLGHIASYYYLSHRTVRLFADELQDSATTIELLQVTSSSIFQINFQPLIYLFIYF